MKKKIELDEKWVQYLSEQPEQGMGYQRVRLILKDGKILRDRVVLNSTYLVLKEDEDMKMGDIEDIQIERI